MTHRPILYFTLGVALLTAVSCSSKFKDNFYLQLRHTVFKQVSESQNTYVCFADDEHVSVIQSLFSDGRTLVSNGVYETDGHTVVCHGTEAGGNQVKFIRTMSHLKNSNNKNLTGLPLYSHGNLEGGIWTTVCNNQLLFVYFKDKETCINGRYAPISGTNSSWTLTCAPYNLEGNQLTVEYGQPYVHARLYEDFLIVDSLGVIRNTPQSAASQNAFNGTFWTYSGGQPSLLIFHGDSYTHIQIQSTRIFATTHGKYREQQGQMEMSDDEEGTTYTAAAASDGNYVTFHGNRYFPLTY